MKSAHSALQGGKRGGEGRGRDAVVDIICKLLPRCFKSSSTVRYNLKIDLSRDICIDRYHILVFILLHSSQGGSKPSV